MPTKPKIRHAFFDLDETLHDRAGTLRLYAKAFHADFGPALSLSQDELMAVLAAEDQGGYRPKAELFAALSARLPWKSRPAPADLAAHWDRHYSALCEALPGMADCLKAVRALGLPIALITNGTSKFQRRKIDLLGIGPFLAGINISEELGMKKPDPGIFKHALADMRAIASESVFVGDHPIMDMQGARGVGFTTIWMRGAYAWPAELPRPDHEIRGLGELPGLLKGKIGGK